MTKTSLQEIHEKMINTAKLREKAQQDSIQAAKIELFLRNVKQRKYYGVNAGKAVSDTMGAAIDEVVANAFNMLNVDQRLKSDLNMFYRSHGIKTHFGGDDIFEEELAAIIASISNLSNGTNLGVKDFLTGTQAGTLPKALINLPADLTEQIFKKFGKKIINRVNSTTQPSDSIVSYVKAKSIKQDVSGLQIEFNGQITNDFQQLALIFNQASFSVKNYSSYTKGLQLHLGNTDPYKAIMSSLLYYGQFSLDEAQRHFRTLMFSKNTKNLQLHLYHLRFMYELTGGGLVDEKGNNLSAVKFFIYNDPSSINIFVRSTAQLILEEMENKQRGTKGAITIGKNRFSNLFNID